jgi:hypothetical protein
MFAKSANKLEQEDVHWSINDLDKQTTNKQRNKPLEKI